MVEDPYELGSPPALQRLEGHYDPIDATAMPPRLHVLYPQVPVLIYSHTRERRLRTRNTLIEKKS